MQQPPVHKITFLNGREVAKWFGTEQALSGGDPIASNDSADNESMKYTPFQWEHPSIPYLQFTDIVLQLADETVLLLYSQYEDGTEFYGFFLIELQNLQQAESDLPKKCNAYRTRELLELPKGIARVAVVRQNGPNAVIEATLTINEEIIRIIAAEVEECANGELKISEPDESILLQLNGARPKISIV